MLTKVMGLELGPYKVIYYCGRRVYSGCKMNWWKGVSLFSSRFTIQHTFYMHLK